MPPTSSSGTTSRAAQIIGARSTAGATNSRDISQDLTRNRYNVPGTSATFSYALPLPNRAYSPRSGGVFDQRHRAASVVRSADGFDQCLPFRPLCTPGLRYGQPARPPRRWAWDFASFSAPAGLPDSFLDGLSWQRPIPADNSSVAMTGSFMVGPERIPIITAHSCGRGDCEEASQKTRDTSLHTCGGSVPDRPDNQCAYCHPSTALMCVSAHG
jgi:hypothetical protein